MVSCGILANYLENNRKWKNRLIWHDIFMLSRKIHAGFYITRLRRLKKEIPIVSSYTKAHLGGSTWNLSRETTEGDVQGLIEGNFPIIATYRKDEPARTGETAWSGEAVWSEEGHFMSNSFVKSPSASRPGGIHPRPVKFSLYETADAI